MASVWFSCHLRQGEWAAVTKCPCLRSQLVRDFTEILTVVGTPILILIDEGNVLAESRPLLQKIRICS